MYFGGRQKDTPNTLRLAITSLLSTKQAAPECI